MADGMDRRPPPHVSPKGMWVSKLVFRIFSAIFSIVIIGLSAATTTMNGGYYYFYSPLLLLVPPAGVGLVWDIAEGICILARRGHRGIHPGAIVAIDLLLWLGFIPGIVWFSLYYIYDIDDYDSSYYYSDYYNRLTTAVSMARAILAMVVLEILIHMLLFIFGCYETSIRNRRGPVIVYAAPPMGHMSMPPNAYGQQPIFLPAGQAPPPGYIPYAYGPPIPGQPRQQPGAPPMQPQPVHQHQHHQGPQQEYYAPSASPLPQEPSPINSHSTPVHEEWRNSYQPGPSQPGPSHIAEAGPGQPGHTHAH